jgi:hypothetical protein
MAYGYVLLFGSINVYMYRSQSSGIIFRLLVAEVELLLREFNAVFRGNVFVSPN